MNKKVNKKDYELYKSFFQDYEEFKELKNYLADYEFLRETEETFNDWLKHNYTLKVENFKEWERRKKAQEQRLIITKLYFK